MIDIQYRDYAPNFLNRYSNFTNCRVGQAMASTEDKAYEIMKELDVDYVLVIFGGLTGYSSDGTILEA